MSTELGIIKDRLDENKNIEVAIGVGGIRLFSTDNKIWLSIEGAKELIGLLKIAILYP